LPLLVLAFLGGALTILSPCILPVIPFVFSRAGLPFGNSGLPMLIGMALTFASVAALASYGGGWVVQANQYGRDAALALLAIFALTLLFPQISELLSRPLVRLGNRLSNPAASKRVTVAQSLVLGVATGLLWAPCAGPILGLILTGAALGGAHVGTVFLLVAYAAGAAISLSIALLAGNKVLNQLKRSLGFEEILRRAIGVLVLVGVAVIALGLDRGVLTRLSEGTATRLEQGLVDRLHPHHTVLAARELAGSGLADEGTFPGFDGASAWLNTAPLTTAMLRGNIVLVDFWTYSCINCLRSLPYVRAWWAAYHDKGLVIVGVHTPEFAFEKDLENVRKAVRDLDVSYPVVLDNNYRIWNAFSNEYWPAHYLIDVNGRIRYHHFGEGNYDETERAVQTLLAERNGTSATRLVHVTGTGVEREADGADVLSPETYLGSARARGFTGPGVPAVLERNHWALEGAWKGGQEYITLENAPGRIIYRFHARDVHLVLGVPTGAAPVRFRVTIDGAAPGNNAGTDTDAQGYGIVREHRLYQLVRQQGTVKDRTVTIEFLGDGVQAYAFTFG
jgi:cytochrome c biogenesis protein CcdA/thiol-disulfide isomerase/thioredoxin